MSHVVNYQNPNQYRKKLLQEIYNVIVQYNENNIVFPRDCLAYILLALGYLEDSINETVNAWEKRNYWLKADRFRGEWDWVENYRKVIKTELTENKDGRVGDLLRELQDKVRQTLKTIPKFRYVDVRGSWDRLNREKP